jgi:DNA polymerase (family 10)
MVENAEIARLFRELADLLEIEGANPFRVRAYRTAARSVEAYPEHVAELAARHPKQLTELRGIGDDLAGKIQEIVATGRLPALDEAAGRLPRGLPALMRLPGLGPKRVAILHKELGIRTTHDLAAALAAGKLRSVRGFGPGTEAKLRHALSARRGEEQRMPLAVATDYAEQLLAYIRSAPGVRQAEVAGSFRRRKETVGDLDILASASKAGPIIERFVAYPEAEEVLATGPTRAAIRLACGLQVDLRVLEPESYGAGLYYFTGSKAHNIAVRRIAHGRGLKVNEYGVWRGKRRVAGETEREVARSVGLPLIPPELREDRGEVEAAQKGRLPRLVTLADIRGDLQCHTTASDGREGLEAMARAAAERGYAYLAITDHTPAVRVTGGLNAAGFKKQRRQIDAWNAAGHHPVLLAGAEVDILADGRLDLDDAALWELDIVLVSLHSRLNLSRREQTRRLVRALQHPAVDILAHPTARLIGRRSGADFDLDEIFRVAADRGMLLEVNAQPDRLDLDDLAVQAAIRHGVRLTISTDAHASQELGFMRWGVDQARRGWATAADVANTRPLKALLGLLHRSRGRKTHRAA